MQSWRAGDRVFAYRDADAYWYPATVVSLDKSGDIKIKFDIGGEEITDSESVNALRVAVGDYVENKAADDGFYYEAEVLDVVGGRIQVGYEDDSTEWTTINNLRLPDWQDYTVGERVLAYRESDGYFYPAEITAMDEAGIHVRYDDGDEEVSDPDYLEPLELMVGEGVECQADDGRYHEAEILEVDEDRVQVEYADESDAWIDISRIRILAVDVDDEEEA